METFKLTEEEKVFCKKLLSLFKIDGKPADTMISEGQLTIFGALVLRKKNRINIITSTQYGKSLIVALACIVLSCIDGEMISIPAPSEDKAKIIMRYYLQHLGDHPLFYSQLERGDKLDRLIMETSRDRLVLKNRGGVFILSVHAKDSQKGFEAAMGEGSRIVIEDESCLIPDNIEATIFRMIAGKGKEAMYVKIGNPFYRNHFYKSANDPRYLQIFIDYKQGIREQRYDIDFIEEARGKPNFDILYGCLFPDGDIMSSDGYMKLLPDADLKKAIIPPGMHAGLCILGVDPAAGGDNSAIVLKSANAQEILFNQRLDDILKLADITADLFRARGAAMVVVDRTGVGEGVFRRLQQMDIPVRGVSFGSKSEDEMFKNLKAELYWRERNWILGGGRLMEHHAWSEFGDIRWENDDRKICIEPKENLFKRGIKSPNVVDAAVLTQFISETAIKNNQSLRQRQGVFFDRMANMMNMPTTGAETNQPHTVWRG
jgi:hypothetical protein